MKKLLFVALLMLPFNVQGLAGSGEHPAPYIGSAEFQKIKSLSGVWKGTHVMNGKEEPAEIQYRVTSNGSAVEETLFPGTPHEMVSIYHEVKGKLQMVHYCALGNQPILQSKPTENGKIQLEYIDSPGIDAAKDDHMHSLELQIGDDTLTQNWVSYQQGKPAGEPTTITLQRAAAN